MRQGSQVLTKLRSQHEENRCRWDSSQGLSIANKHSMEEWFNRSFWNILAQDFFFTKHDFYDKEISLRQGIMTEGSNSWCTCSIIMIMMHSWDAWLQCWCNTMMECSMRKWNGAYDMMQLPWCRLNDAYTMMQGWWCSWFMHINRCTSMMHTHMSLWCTWFAPITVLSWLTPC